MSAFQNLAFVPTGESSIPAMSGQTQHVASLAFTCQLWQVGYGILFNELRRRGIEPVLMINGVAHYDTEALEQMMCDLENAGRVRPRPLTIHVPANCVKIIEPATGSKRAPACPPPT